MTDTNSQEEVIVPENKEGEETKTDENISIPKKDYDTLNQTLGSLKRELKDLKKVGGETKETPEKTKLDENRLLERIEKMSLNQVGITHEDDVALAKATAKKWNVDLEDVLKDDDFKAKLEKQQTSRDNLAATSKVKGGAGTSQAKNTPEYWIAKGTPPTRADVPDRKTRATIARAMMSNAKSGKKFYND
jgi:hypothetical protein